MALLVSLFALMLICVVGVALIMASGTDTALNVNYRSATGVYYAALAGLEEGRGRLLTKSPNNLATAMGVPGTLPGMDGNVAQAWYIINPLPGEVVTPWDTSPASVYPDNEYAQEFGIPPPTTQPDMQQTVSVSSLTPGPQGPMYTMYKWVRINTITANSMATSTNVNVGGAGPGNAPVLFANGHLYTDPVAGGVPALEITALAAIQMPNGTLSQRMLQYVVAPVTLFSSTGMTFPAALTLDGTNVQFTGPLSAPPIQFFIQGIDTVPSPNCLPGAAPQAGIGFTIAPPDNSFSNITTFVAPDNGGIPPAYAANYTGAGGAIPNVSQVVLPSSWQSPSGLDTLVHTVLQNVDLPAVNSTPYVGGTANGAIFQNALPGWGQNPPVPVTMVVNGDLDLSTWSGVGYGILLVTGNLTLNSNVTWNGLLLVIGTGQVDVTAGSGQINGAVVVAQALDPTNPARPLLPGPSLGAAAWTQTAAPGGSGAINYSSCWINAVQTPTTYKVLSFREIPLS